MISECDLRAYFIRNGEDNVYQLSSYCQALTVTFRRVADGHEVHCAVSSALEIELINLSLRNMRNQRMKSNRDVKGWDRNGCN